MVRRTEKKARPEGALHLGTLHKKARLSAGFSEREKIVGCLDGLRQIHIGKFNRTWVIAFVFGYSVAATQALVEFVDEEVDGFVAITVSIDGTR